MPGAHGTASQVVSFSPVRLNLVFLSHPTLPEIYCGSSEVQEPRHNIRTKCPLIFTSIEMLWLPASALASALIPTSKTGQLAWCIIENLSQSPRRLSPDSGKSDLPKEMTATHHDAADRTEAHLELCEESVTLCDTTLTPRNSQLQGAENSFNDNAQLRNERRGTSKPLRSSESVAARRIPVMKSSHDTIEISSIDDPLRCPSASLAPKTSVDSLHIRGDTITTAAHCVINSPDGLPLRMDDSPSGGPDDSYKAETERTVGPSETLKNQCVSVDNCTLSSDQVGQSGVTNSTPSYLDDGTSNGTVTKESDDPQSSLLFQTSRQPESSLSCALTDWQPIYLQPRVQVPVMCAFILLAATVEGLLVISLRNDGVTTSKEDVRHLWKYGPTALLTLIAAVWGRVAFQAQLVAPWYRLIHSPTEARNSSILDYFDMIKPAAIFNSLKNHDWIVSVSLSVSLLVQLVIVLSTGLINLSLTEVTDGSYPMTVTKKFLDREEPVTVPSKDVLRMINGLLMSAQRGYLTFPDGTTDLYAWETFETEAPVGTETRVTVPGFSANLTCEPAATEVRYYLNEDVVHPLYPCGAPWITMNISSTSRDCTATYSTEARTWYRPDRTDSVYFSTLFKSDCQGGREPERNRLFYIFGLLDPPRGGDYHCYDPQMMPQDINFRKSTSLICDPGYIIQELDISQNGSSDPIVQLNKNSSFWTLENVHPWSIMNTTIASMAPQGSVPTNINTIQLLDADVILDSCTFFVFLIGGATKQTASSMLDSATLEEVLLSYYQKHAAQIAPFLLMKPSNEPREGTAILLERRLLISPRICHTITGLLIVAGLASLAIATSSQTRTSLPFDPSIPYGIVTAFTHADGACSGRQLSLRGFHGPDNSPRVLSIFSYLTMPTLSHGIRTASLFKAISEAQVHNHHGLEDVIDGRPKLKTPLTLQSHSRAFVSLAILGIMVILGVTLAISNANRGLGETGSAPYTHLLWTSLPAVIFSGLSLMLGSMTSAVLCLSPYWNMKRSAHFKGSMGLNLLGKLPPISLWRAVQLGFVAAATAAAASMLTPWFNIFTSSLFEAIDLPMHSGASLLTTGSFGSLSLPWNDSYSLYNVDVGFQTTLAFQILQENKSYPAFTWENLAFPEFNLNGLSTSHDYNLNNATIEATVPALRSSLSCEPYNSSLISSTMTLDYIQHVGFFAYRGGPLMQTFNVSNPLVLNLTGEECAHSMPDDADTLSVVFDTTIGGATPSHAPFMAGFERYDEGQYGLLSGENLVRVGNSCISEPFIFIWGHFNLSRDHRRPHISASAVACTPTVELVDVKLTFRGPELAIDSLWVDDASARRTSFGEALISSAYRVPLFSYKTLRGIFSNSRPQLFDGFASMLTTSPYALTPEDIGDPDKAQQVEDAIKFQFGILQTQYFHISARCTANSTNATLPNYVATSPENATDALTYPAVVTVPNGNHRVVQDPMSTYILQGLLAVVLVLTLVSWAFSLRPGVLPRSPTSIANVLSLATGGNLLEFVVKNADGGPPDEDSFDKYIFWLGWRKVSMSDGVEQERFGIWVLTAKEFEVIMEERRRSKLTGR